MLSSHLNYLYLKLERGGGGGNFTSKLLTWINCNFVDKSKLAQKKLLIQSKIVIIMRFGGGIVQKLDVYFRPENLSLSLNISFGKY